MSSLSSFSLRLFFILSIFLSSVSQSSGLGKTCLLFRFAEDSFNNSFISATGIDLKIRTIELDGKKIKFHMWDTVGQEWFRTITTAYYRGAMGMLPVYDVTSDTFFDNIKNSIRNIEEHASADVEKIVLDNKYDMNDRRQGSKERRAQLEYGIKFMETSAKPNIDVEDAFFTLASSRVIKAKTDENSQASTTQSAAYGRRLPTGSQNQQSKRLSFFSGWKFGIL